MSASIPERCESKLYFFCGKMCRMAACRFFMFIFRIHGQIETSQTPAVQAPFIEQARRTLAAGGRLQVVTDHQGYWEDNIEPLVRAASGFSVVDYNRPDPRARGNSWNEFREEYRREGRPFYAIAAIRTL